MKYFEGVNARENFRREVRCVLRAGYQSEKYYDPVLEPTDGLFPSKQELTKPLYDEMQEFHHNQKPSCTRSPCNLVRPGIEEIREPSRYC